MCQIMVQMAGMNIQEQEGVRFRYRTEAGHWISHPGCHKELRRAMMPAQQ